MGGDDRTSRRPTEAGRLRILFCALGDDYGDPSRGISFEAANFQSTLEHMDLEVMHFDIAREILTHGYWSANERLERLVDSWAPDVLLSVMFEEQIDLETMRRISQQQDFTTVAWFCDDHWRFDGYSRHWARAFNWVVTTQAEAIPRYKAIGQENVICSQWACNHFAYRPHPGAEYGITFVGQPHGRRKRMVTRFRRAGLPVATWGRGWPEGHLPFDKMLGVFTGSAVSLNFSSSSTGPMSWGGRRLQPQIKGRVFEVPGCQGCLLTEWAPGLETFYEPDSEIAVFRTPAEMIRKARHLLSSPDERHAIASAGYRRTLREHTYVHRLTDIFNRIGAMDEGEVARQLDFAGCLH